MRLLALSFRIGIASLIGAFFWSPSFASVSTITGKVTAVVDGNTLNIVTEDGDTYRVKLFGIDCPELGQAYGDKAKTCLQRLVLKKDVTVSIEGRDRKGDYLGVVKTEKNVDPRVDLLREGLAWVGEKAPSPDLEQYVMAAREHQKGLWREQDPTPPWIFRRQQSMLQAKGS